MTLELIVGMSAKIDLNQDFVPEAWVPAKLTVGWFSFIKHMKEDWFAKELFFVIVISDILATWPVNAR